MAYKPTIVEVDTAAWLEAGFEEERDVFAGGAGLQSSATDSSNGCMHADRHDLDWS